MSDNGKETSYSRTELMICVTARLFEDGATAFIGTGIPMLAASLAQRLYAPHLVTIFEFGGTGAILEHLPMAVGGAGTFHHALAAAGICDVMEAAQRGFIDYGFIGGAQIDPFGNLNSTVIGSYDKPKVRLPGSGGGNDVGSFCWRTIAIMQHDTRRFVEKCDFITTPGYLTGFGAREEAGLPPGTGPLAVITGLGRMGYDPSTCRMRLDALAPGVTVEQVQASTGFELLLSDEIEEIYPPDKEELRLLREEIDRDHLYI
jgi:glutaconate CoA-transferase subunit B